MKNPPEKGERVCDMHATKWGTVDEPGKFLTYVIWDADPKSKPRKEHTSDLFSTKHPNPFGVHNNISYMDPGNPNSVIKEKLLDWKPGETPLASYEEAILGTPEDGVRFTYVYQGSCYRRGQHKLLIDVFGGPNHEKWGCFDDQDQPMRYYHKKTNLLSEANEIALILLIDRLGHGPHPTLKLPNARVS
jgi:hypothetical protein